MICLPSIRSCSSLRVLATALLVSLLLLPFASAQGPRGKASYDKNVFPVLQQFCYDCHGDGMDKGNFALDKHGEFSASFGDKKFWDNVREHVDTHVMPPDGKTQPSLEQRAAIVKWIEDEVFWVDPAKPDPGHITLRRLNRSEYNNTVRDVFRIDTRPASNFPPDDSGYGYDNIGDVLSLSPLLMEKYLKAARKVSEDSVWVKTSGRLAREKNAHQFEDGENDVSDKLDDEVRSITKNGEITAKYEIPTSGLWRAELEVSASQVGSEKVKLAVLVDGKEVRQFEVNTDIHAAKGEKWERVRFDVPLKGGYRTVAIRFLNDFFDEKAPDPNRRDRNAFVRYLMLQGPMNFRTPDQSKLLDWLAEGKRLGTASLTLQGADFDPSSADVGVSDDTICFASNGHVHRAIDIPEDGTYTLRMTVAAEQSGPELAKLRVVLGDQVLADAREIKSSGASVTEAWVFQAALKKGSYDFRVEFLNDWYGGEGKDRNAYFKRVIVDAPADRSVQVDPAMVLQWIDKLGLKVMRRPLEDADKSKIHALADMVLKDGGTPLDALKLSCEAMLVSSKFLFRGGATPTGVAESGSVLVDEYTLASRLSYFLWASAPDDELLRLAQAGELRKNLPQQIDRMIGDWKGASMTENFAGQWLQLRDVDLVAPSTRRYPDWNSRLASAMKKETQLYFDHIYRDNRSVLEFLDSDYTFANERLSRYYELPKTVKGDEFEKVSLEGTARGGILTHGSILTITSHPNRTSPVKRGKFLLENILGTPPPPAPQDVPAFREDRGARVQGTLRQRFEAHRANPSCASCHAFLDPMGFAFENYDAIGRWREHDNGQPVDTSGKLLTGQQFAGAEQLRKVLANDRKNEFTKCLVENLLTYALGRGLDYPDKPFVKSITARAAGNGYKFQDIVKDVIASPPFQRMRTPEAAKTAGAE